MAINRRTIRLEQELRQAIAEITNQQVRDLTGAWAAAWDEIAPELTATLQEMLVAGDGVTRSQLLKSQRMRKVLVLIAGQLDDLVVGARGTVLDDLTDLIEISGGAQASIIDSQLPARSPKLVDLDAWSRVDPRQVSAIVRRSTQQITARTRPLSAEAYQSVRRELLRGIAAGANPRVTARRILARTEGHFNGGLSRALTIARTESIDACRAAAQLGQAEHTDVLAGWQWLASLGPRTCPACWGMNGTFHDLDEPGPLGHQNCRCARIPVTKPWSELGLKGLKEPASLIPNADTAFKAMSKADQVRILGPKGWAAWDAGKFPRSSWAVRRSTTGWRDSYHSAKPPELKGKDAGIIVEPPRTPVPGKATGRTPGEVTREKGVTVDQHERITSYRLASLGENVHWLTNPSGAKTPDAVVRNLIWEIKAPEGKTFRTIRNNLANAHAKADRVILDLYRSELRHDLEQVRASIEAYWAERLASGAARRIETVWVLTDDVSDHYTLEYAQWLSQR